MKVEAFAPAKVILFGEHYVVYGADGIACGITPYNKIVLQTHEDGPAFEREDGLGRLKIWEDGKVECPDALKPAAEAYFAAKEKWPEIGNLRIRADYSKVWGLKGVGNSASLASALAAGLAKLAGKEASAQECFEVAQRSDKVAHGGSPSGIDAAAVSYGGPVTARKIFGAAIAYDFGKAKFGEAEGWEFLIVDTMKAGVVKASTAGQIAKFAKINGIAKKPEELSDVERADVCKDYAPVSKKALSALASADMESVARLMNENQKMLADGGASSEGIEEAVGIALDNGAEGAKLSGAGGEGGAVLALCKKEKVADVEKALLEAGCKSYPFRISDKGAHAKKSG